MWSESYLILFDNLFASSRLKLTSLNGNYDNSSESFYSSTVVTSGYGGYGLRGLYLFVWEADKRLLAYYPSSSFGSSASACVCTNIYIYIHIHIYTHSFASVMSLCDPMDHSPPGSSVHRIFLARILAENSVPLSHQGTNCYLYVS